jgi:hypothetical protein
MVYDDPSARRAAERGELVRIRRGVYVRADVWRELDARDRYRMVCRGFSLSRADPPVLTHRSAAALWNLPTFWAMPSEVDIALESSAGGRVRAGVRGHAAGLDADDVVFIDGVPVTSLLRTVVDMAASADVHTAVAIIDHCLHVDRFGRSRYSITRDALLEALAEAGLARGGVRARARITFGSPQSGSPAESASRTTMALIGVPAPELQRTFECETGTYDSDFYWASVDAIGEVDGRGKYLDPALRRGRSAGQVVYGEKVREDELRRKVTSFIRWDPPVALSLDRLRARLAPHGLHAGRPRLAPR